MDFTIHLPPILPSYPKPSTRIIQVPVRYDGEVKEWLMTEPAHKKIDHEKIRELLKMMCQCPLRPIKKNMKVTITIEDVPGLGIKTSFDFSHPPNIGQPETLTTVQMLGLSVANHLAKLPGAQVESVLSEHPTTHENN